MKGEPSVPIFRKKDDIPPPPDFTEGEEISKEEGDDHIKDDLRVDEPEVPLPPSELQESSSLKSSSDLYEKKESLLSQKEQAIKDMLSEKLSEIDRRENDLDTKQKMLEKEEQDILMRIEKLEKTEEDLRIVESSMTKKYEKMMEIKRFISEEDDKIRQEIREIENARSLKQAIPKIQAAYSRIKDKMRRIEKEALGKFVVIKEKEKELKSKEQELNSFSESLIEKEEKLKKERAAFEHLKGEGIFNLIKEEESYIPSHESSKEENQVRQLLEDARDLIKQGDKKTAEDKIRQAESIYHKMDDSRSSDITYEIMELQTEIKLADL